MHFTQKPESEIAKNSKGFIDYGQKVQKKFKTSSITVIITLSTPRKVIMVKAI